MKAQYRPKTLGQALGYLTEEAGEVLQAVGKSRRWGLLSVNPELRPGEQESNLLWLQRELVDLRLAIDIAEDALRLAVEADDFSDEFQP